MLQNEALCDLKFALCLPREQQQAQAQKGPVCLQIILMVGHSGRPEAYSRLRARDHGLRLLTALHLSNVGDNVL